MHRAAEFLDFAHMPNAPHEFHTSVLRQEATGFLNPAPGKVLYDGTLGGGGYSELLLRAGASVVATDLDPDAIHFASLRLGGFQGWFRPAQASFSQIDAVLEKFGIPEIHGAVLDLGVSGHELDTPLRGFSLKADGPLDMRLGPTVPRTAADIVNLWDEAELARIFRDFGDEPAARRVARRIAEERTQRPFDSTLQLAECIARVVPKRSHIHPATRCFQAIRIAVNDELAELERGIEAISRRLAPGARFAIVSFHSGEDSIVKHRFRDLSREWLDRPEWPAPRRNPERIFRLLTPKPITPSASEIEANSRARSAKLRVVERITP